MLTSGFSRNIWFLIG